MDHQLRATGDSTATRGARAQGSVGVHPASWGSQRCGGRPGDRLKPHVKVTIEGVRSPRLGGDVVTSEDMSDFVVAYLEYEQHMHVANEDGRQGAHEKARAGRFGDTNDGC